MSKEHTLIRRVHLAHADANLAKQLWDVQCLNGRVHNIAPADTETKHVEVPDHCSVVAGDEGVLLPSLCHAHIHLDKCFILEQCDPLLTGSLPEALRVTNKAKAGFPERQPDLYARATRLIRESVEAGVTVMRAYVEIDTAVHMVCLDIGLKLKSEWKGVCDIQIVAFAQEALYPSLEAQSPGENFNLLKSALTKPGIGVVGSAPWVEPSREHAHKNIAHILALAQAYNLHADFHLDYNLDANAEPMVWEALRQMRLIGWTRASAGKRRVTIGHATRLGMFSSDEWARLRKELEELPLEIVALPQSDIYMMGRPSTDGTLTVPLARRTLDAARIWRDHGVRVAMSVNNVENAFTPQGYLDPLTLASLGVGLFQVGTEPEWRELLRSVSTTSKETIGMGGGDADLTKSKDNGLVPRVGDPADFVLVHEAKRWQSAVLSPGFDRTTVFSGRVVARRRASRWTAVDEAETVAHRD
ncbi:hypothetical protein HYDPIDRAFT_114421 [Hydnomerulius pinastri MD-312]|uniref:Metallo-dependent hydrolase n=1 Tax=Hydnomerulius pinastri MD-312 TaxID=994086 RepID=A0A0C9WD49_9AGAM|nr:hypothetical protein HYDPIDRAFT_114421 [Hydnomerulius pinastri MD-312]